MLGLIVVVVFLAIVSGRIDLRRRFPQLFSRTRIASGVTPTPTPMVESQQTNTYQTNTQENGLTKKTTQTNYYTPKTIPATGSPTILLPIIITGLGVGSYLRNRRIKAGGS